MEIEEIIINDEFIKLSQLLKFANMIYSGGEAKEVIADGLVKVNGQVETQKGKKIYKNDIVEFQGIQIIVK